MTTTQQDIEVAPELAEFDLEDKPDGPAAAAMVAAGIGVFMLGIFTTGAVIFEGLKDFLTDFQGSRGVGALAGKSTMAFVFWLGSWGILHRRWKDRDFDLKLAFKIGAILGIIGALLTFPPIFEAFE